MKIIVLRGLPGSGKSTWCKTQNIESISKDNIRELLHRGVYSKANEKEVLAYRNIKIMTAVISNEDIIVDDTNLNPIHIQSFKNIRDEYREPWRDVEIEIKDFPTDIETCIERDSKRDKPVGEKVIRDMANKWNYPPKKPEFEPIATFSDDKQDAVIFDIDGTLAKNVSRSPYDMTRVSEDEVHKDIAHLLMIMSQYYRIIFVSGRDDSCSVDTIQWIKDNTYSCYPMSTKLHMRDVGDNRNDAIVKYEIAQRLNKDFNIRYVFDDRDRVVKMWREAGFRCLQVANGNF